MAAVPEDQRSDEAPPEELPRLLTAEELAAWMGVSLATVYKEARAGRIPARQVGREWRFLLEAVVDWFHSPIPPAGLGRQWDDVEPPEAGDAPA